MSAFLKKIAHFWTKILLVASEISKFLYFLSANFYENLDKI